MTLISDEGKTKLEVLNRTRSGAWIEVEVTAVALRDAAGGLVGYVSVSHDLTTRKRAQAALRASQEKLQRILETSNDGVWILDAQGRTDFLNKRAGEIFGLDPRRAQDRSPIDCLPASLVGAARADLASCGTPRAASPGRSGCSWT